MSIPLANMNKSLRKSQSMPHLLSRNDSGFGYSGAGSCNVLDQMGYNTMFPNQRDEKVILTKKLMHVNCSKFVFQPFLCGPNFVLGSL